MDFVNARKELAIDEGVRLKAYDDATGKELMPGDTLKGNLTIGTGHNLTANGISESVNLLMLNEDIQNALDDCIKIFANWYKLPPSKQNILLNMTFNMGSHAVSKFVNMIAAVNVLDFNKAADEMLDSNWARDPLTTHRAHKLATRMRG